MTNIFKAGWYKKQMELWMACDEYNKEKQEEARQTSLKLDILEKENKTLRQCISDLEQRVGDPAEVIKKILGRPIKWKDISKMKPAQQRAYFLEAKNVLENEAFTNELNAMEYDLVNEIATKTADFQQVLNRRFILCGALALRDRLADIPSIDETEEDEEELNDAI
jgi:hypothetical protein